MNAGKPVWIDFGSTDFAASKTFYEQLFGWRFDDMGDEMGHYHMVRAGEDLIAGGMDIAGMTCPDGQPLRSSWDVYLGSDDVDATFATALAAGATQLAAPDDAGDAGRFANLLDPTGATVGVWQPGSITSFVYSGRPGTPAWFELMTQDFDASIAFYTAAFGLDPHPMAEPMEDDSIRYVTHGSQEDAAYGICDAAPIVPSEVGSFWRIYFIVDGLDAAVDRAKALGGSLVDGPADSPFGRIATVADPAGASFQVVSPGEATPE